MSEQERPTPSSEELTCGAILYWITLVGTLIGIAGMVFGMVTDHNFNSPSSWISSIWDGRHTDNIWHSNSKSGLEAAIQSMVVSGDVLICNTEPDRSGNRYILEISSGELRDDCAAVGEAIAEPGGEVSIPLVVEYSGQDFVIKDVSGNIIGSGSVATDSSPYEIVGSYAIVASAVGDVDNDPDSEVILLANHTESYPAQIYVVDPTGSPILRYWNPGHLYTICLADSDGDGDKEIFVGGTNRDQLWSHISTPAVYALNLPMEELELETAPYSGNIGKGNEEWDAFPDTQEPPLSHWYLSHLGEGDGLATFGIAVGVFVVIPALVIPAIIYLRRREPVFAGLALIAAVITIVSMLGLIPLAG